MKNFVQLYILEHDNFRLKYRLIMYIKIDLCLTLHVLSLKHEYLCNYLIRIKYIIEKKNSKVKTIFMNCPFCI